MAFELDEKTLNTAAGTMEGDIQQIQTAIYGREVRAAIAEALYMLYTNLTDLMSKFGVLSYKLTTLDGKVTDQGETIAELSANFTALSEELTALDGKVTDQGETIAQISSNLDAIDEEVTAQGNEITKLSEDLAELNGVVAAQGETVTELSEKAVTLDEKVTALQELSASQSEQLIDLSNRLTTLEETVAGIAKETVVYSEPVGTGVTATLYGSGGIRVNGSGAAEQSLSLEFSDAVESRYSITSRWEVMYGVTSLCDGFLSDIGAYAAIHGVIPGTYLPSSLTQIGDSAIPSISVGYAGTMEQWKSILGSDGESTITNSIFPSVMRNMQIAIRCSDGVLTWNAGAWEEQTT